MQFFYDTYDNNINSNDLIFFNILNNYTFRKLILFSGINCFLYFVLYNLLTPTETFKKLDYNKKMYIIKNIIKSYFLFYIFVIGTRRILYFIINDIYDMDEVRYYGSIYVSCDLFALLIIPKLPKTTKIHHLSTLFLLSIVGYYDANEKDVVKFICIYTTWSYFAFMVNFYLGIRFFIVNKEEDKLTKSDRINNKIIDIIRISSYYNYLICCIFNWTIHIYLLSIKLNNFNMDIMTTIYLIFLIPIIKDDLILMSWLKNKSQIK